MEFISTSNNSISFEENSLRAFPHIIHKRGIYVASQVKYLTRREG